MSVIDLPLFRLRKRVGGIRHLMIEAAEVLTGEVAELSCDTSRELAEIWLMPENATAFLSQMLESAQVSMEELVLYCEDAEVRQRILNTFLTSLKLGDAEWYLENLERNSGYVIRMIVGHKSAMQLACDHGFLPEVRAAEQRTARRFAFNL